MKRKKKYWICLSEIAVGIFILASVLSFGPFLSWLANGTQWHAGQSFAQKLMRQDVLLALLLWCLAVLFLYFLGTTGLRSTSVGLFVVSGIYAWLITSLLSAFATPHTSRMCFKSITVSYECDALDLVIKFLVFVVSLGFPAPLFGMMRLRAQAYALFGRGLS